MFAFGESQNSFMWFVIFVVVFCVMMLIIVYWHLFFDLFTTLLSRQNHSTFMCFNYFKVTLWCDGEYVPMLKAYDDDDDRHSSFLVSSLIWNRFGTFCDTHLFKYWLTLHYQTLDIYLLPYFNLNNTYTLLTEWHWFIFGVSQHV